MTTDHPVVSERVDKLGSADPLAEHLALTSGPVCEHHVQALFLAGMVCQIARDTDYNLGALIQAERDDLFAVDPEPPGFA